MSETADAVIIGAGVIGCAVAFELAKGGYRTLSIDKLPAAGYGSTSSSSAVVRAHYSSRDGVAMAFEGFSCWSNWADYLEAGDERGLATYIDCGSVLLKSDDGLHPKATAHYRALGVPHEDWDTAALKQRLPYYDVHRFWPPSRPDDESFWREPDGELPGAIYTPGSGYVRDPQLATHNLQMAAEAKGSRFAFRRRVVEILGDSQVNGVRLDDGIVVHAPIVVNVAGPHSSAVNRMAGVEADMKIKTRPMRHEVHVVPAPSGIDLEQRGLHTADDDLGIYFRPEHGNTFLVGSEDPPCDPRHWEDDPDQFNRHPTRPHWEAQVYRLARRIPSVRVPLVMSGLADLYDVSDDWIPVYDASDRPGYFMAVGSSGNQFKNAPVAGHLMAQLIDSCMNGVDHDLQPVQVATRCTGLTINAGFFSRNRDPIEGSTFSVNG
jgi:glycine/D-amino acid oxidase-like deaminating enzyme